MHLHIKQNSMKATKENQNSKSICQQEKLKMINTRKKWRTETINKSAIIIAIIIVNIINDVVIFSLYAWTKTFQM